MFIKNIKTSLCFIFISFFTRIFASQEPITQEKNIIQKIDSWASITSDSSWEDTKKDFHDFLSILERIKYLAENNSFFEDDEASDDELDSDDSDNDDEEEIDDQFDNNARSDSHYQNKIIK